MIENRDLFWLWTHCREIGMKGKSDSGRMEDDIALFTVTLCDELERLRAEVATIQVLLRDLLPYLEEWHTPSEEHAQRIRAALGDEN